MTTYKILLSLYQLRTTNIPYIYPASHPGTLNQFLITTQTLHDRFYNHADPGCYQNFKLLAVIQAKIVQPAADKILAAQLTSHEQIKEALLKTYSDRRDHITLEIELIEARQTDRETPFQYYDKINQLMVLIISYIRNHQVEDGEALIKHYQALALRCFLLNLKEPLGSIMRTRQPPDLGTALSWLTNDYQTLEKKSHPNPNDKGPPIKTPRPKF